MTSRASNRAAPRWAAIAAIAICPAAALAQQPKWESLPRMQLERQFGGPLQDTLIQRWRDSDGTICYIYLPVTAQHSPPTASGYVQYGPNAIGSISCIAAAAPPASNAHAHSPQAQASSTPRPVPPAPQTPPAPPPKSSP